MYTIATANTLSQGWGSHFQNGGVNPTGMLCYFTGPVPSSIAEIPFDEKNIYDIFSNMEGCLQYTSNKITDPANPHKVKFQASQKHSFVATKQPFFEVALDKWSYQPKLQILEGVWLDRHKGNFDILDSATWWGSQYVAQTHTYLLNNLSLNFANHGMDFRWHPYRVRDHGLRDQNGYDFYSYWGISSSRNAGNLYPLVLEFDEVISIDTIEYYRGHFSGNGNSSVAIGIYYWDQTLLAGEGDWVFSETITVLEAGVNTPIELVPLVNPIEAKVFKLSFGDTASSTFHFSWIRFLSTTSPTTPRPSVDITWGLVIPYVENAASFGAYYLTDRYQNRHPIRVEDKIPYDSQHNLPVLLVDVGGPHNPTATVNLTKAEQVLPGEVPELLNFVIEFLD